MARFRNEKKTHYTTIDNGIFKDNQLSLKAKGMLCTLLSLPNSWNFTEAGLCKLSLDSITAVRGALQELIQRGYLIRTQDKDLNGKFGEMIYIIFDEPTVITKSDNGKTDIGKKTQYNTNIINNLNNIKENTISKDIVKRKVKFVPPTLQEIQNYITEKGYDVNAKFFYDYFNESDWIDSNGNKVKNWKQKIITWNSHNQKSNKNNYKQEKQFEDIYEPFKE